MENSKNVTQKELNNFMVNRLANIEAISTTILANQLAVFELLKRLSEKNHIDTSFVSELVKENNKQMSDNIDEIISKL